MNDLMIKVNKMWRQRAKKFWLVGGDKNTKHFHSRATQWHRGNRMSSIYNPNGEWIYQQETIADTLTDFYQRLLTSTNPVLSEEALQLIPKLLTGEMNAMLAQEFM